MTNNDIVQKLWNLCDVLRDDGINYSDYVTELVLLFIKMVHENTEAGLLQKHALPEGCRWLDLNIEFADKKANSTGMQLADLVARPVGLQVLLPSQPNRAFEVLKPKLYCKSGRSKVGAGVEGWGLKRFP